MIRTLMNPGGSVPFDINDEDMPPGHSNDPPGPGPPGSGPHGGGPYGPVPSQPPVDPDDTPFPMEYKAEILCLRVHQGLPLAPYRNIPIRTFHCHIGHEHSDTFISARRSAASAAV